MEVVYNAGIVLLSIALYLMLLCYRYVVGRKEKSSLPTNWPVLGMLPALLKNGSRFHQFVTELAERSGGTFLFKGPWFTNMDMLLTSDPANIHYILTKSFPNFSKGPEFKKKFNFLGDGIFAAENESWERQRKAIKALMTQSGFQELVATTSWNKVETGLIRCSHEANVFDLIATALISFQQGRQIDVI
ncbi:UNVERIFIED_CONTAM: Alkane hydroxylase MAH1 [Sesamum radiatum]|uniref:Alkane hydroxylase MAH1 n=1 Tax=Sesamum radiatum TaxID=300843 RepID=A0AAW2KGJ2_SESRA